MDRFRRLLLRTFLQVSLLRLLARLLPGASLAALVDLIVTDPNFLTGNPWGRAGVVLAIITMAVVGARGAEPRDLVLGSTAGFGLTTLSCLITREWQWVGLAASAMMLSLIAYSMSARYAGQTVIVLDDRDAAMDKIATAINNLDADYAGHNLLPESVEVTIRGHMIADRQAVLARREKSGLRIVDSGSNRTA